MSEGTQTARRRWDASEEVDNSTTAYYNENDPFAAAWLRELITGAMLCALWLR